MQVKSERINEPNLYGYRYRACENCYRYGNAENPLIEARPVFDDGSIGDIEVRHKSCQRIGYQRGVFGYGYTIVRYIDDAPGTPQNEDMCAERCGL